MNPDKPRIVNVQFVNELKMNRGYAEFDTEESAREWRREFSGE